MSFLELYQGKFYDLFCTTPGLRQEAPVRIRDERSEDGTVTIHMSGVSHCDVARREDIMDLLRRGSLDRVTASTDMNERSSRSHAIFTIWITHRRHISQAMREVRSLSLSPFFLGGGMGVCFLGARLSLGCHTRHRDVCTCACVM